MSPAEIHAFCVATCDPRKHGWESAREWYARTREIYMDRDCGWSEREGLWYMYQVIERFYGGDEAAELEHILRMETLDRGEN